MLLSMKLRESIPHLILDLLNSFLLLMPVEVTIVLNFLSQLVSLSIDHVRSFPLSVRFLGLFGDDLVDLFNSLLLLLGVLFLPLGAGFFTQNINVLSSAFLPLLHV